MTSADEPDVFERLQRVGDAPPVEVPPVVPRIVESAPTGRVRRVASPATPVTEADARTASMPVVSEPPEPIADESAPVPPDLHPLRTRRALITRRPRPRVRRVTRVVRYVDTWSVFKVAMVFSLVLVVVLLTAGVLLWNVAYATGTIDNVENFFEQFGWSTFEFQGREIFDNAVVAGIFLAIGLTGLAVLTAAVFNLISDVVGGVRLTVLEEEVVVRLPQQSARRPVEAVAPDLATDPGAG